MRPTEWKKNYFILFLQPEELYYSTNSKLIIFILVINCHSN